MKHSTLLFLPLLLTSSLLRAQTPSDKQRREITSVIDQYALAREKKDTVLLKAILTPDVDQLVSTGEWRYGVSESVKGMLRSSEAPGTRKIIVEKVKLLAATSAIVDCRYEITNADGSVRKMWSTFVVVNDKNKWKIAGIRNMLPGK